MKNRWWWPFYPSDRTIERELSESAMRPRLTMTSGVGLIARERARQITDENWTSEHDDTHRVGELACAAAVYATPPIDRDDYGDHGHPQLWPWSDSYRPTPGDRVSELVRAGALIAAEIDRLQRAGASA